MNAMNYIKLEFPSKSCNEAFARTAAAAFAAQLDPTLDELGDIKTAVSEAVTNCIVHAYPDDHRHGHPCAVQDTRRTTCWTLWSYATGGCGIADLEQAMQPHVHNGRRGAQRHGLYHHGELYGPSSASAHAPGKGTTVTHAAPDRTPGMDAE